MKYCFTCQWLGPLVPRIQQMVAESSSLIIYPADYWPVNALVTSLMPSALHPPYGIWYNDGAKSSIPSTMHVLTGWQCFETLLQTAWSITSNGTHTYTFDTPTTWLWKLISHWRASDTMPTGITIYVNLKRMQFHWWSLILNSGVSSYKLHTPPTISTRRQGHCIRTCVPHLTRFANKATWNMQRHLQDNKYLWMAYSYTFNQPSHTMPTTAWWFTLDGLTPRHKTLNLWWFILHLSIVPIPHKSASIIILHFCHHDKKAACKLMTDASLTQCK